MAILTAFSKVFRHPTWIIVAIISGWFMFTVSLTIPHYTFLWAVGSSDAFSLNEKFRAMLTVYGAFSTAFPPAQLILIPLISLLVGVNVAMVGFYVREQAVGMRAAGSSVLGIGASIIGIGCSACGSVILSSLIGIVATNTFTAALPLRGLEFSLLGLFFICLAIYIVGKRIVCPAVCAPSLRARSRPSR